MKSEFLQRELESREVARALSQEVLKRFFR